MINRQFWILEQEKSFDFISSSRRRAWEFGNNSIAKLDLHGFHLFLCLFVCVFCFGPPSPDTLGELRVLTTAAVFEKQMFCCCFSFTLHKNLVKLVSLPFSLCTLSRATQLGEAVRTQPLVCLQSPFLQLRGRCHTVPTINVNAYVALTMYQA